MAREEWESLRSVRRLRLSVLAALVVVVVGTVGYLLLGAASLTDAVYMVAITLTTVGYGEVVELGEGGRWFTMAILIAGFGAATLTAAAGTEVLVDGHARALLSRRLMDRRITALSGHVIVCGHGRVGRHLVAELAAARRDFVVVEEAPASVDALRSADHLHVVADATEEQTLVDAGIERASALVACVAEDGDNVLIVLTAKGLNPDVQVVTRVKAEENEAKLRRAGADHVLVPTAIGGRRIAEMLTRPAVGAFLGAVGVHDFDYTLGQVTLAGASSLVGRTVGEARLREEHGCTLLALQVAGTPMPEAQPDRLVRLGVGDTLVVMGGADHVAELMGRHGDGGGRATTAP